MTDPNRPVGAVLVNYRTAALAVAAIASLEGQRDDLRSGLVAVVDNDSGDDSLRVLREAIESRGWSSWVKLLPQARNGGFAYGVNQGVRGLRDHFGTAAFDLLLVNPDTEARPGAVRAMLECLDHHADVGIVGSPIELGDGSADSSAHRWPTPLSELVAQARLGALDRLLPDHVVSPPSPAGAARCDWVSGAFFLIRHEALTQVGDFDEGYFLYYEEVDYCRRARAAGWSCMVAAGPGITHWEGSSTGIAEAHKPRPRYWFDSRRRYLVTYYGWLGLAAADLLSITGRGLFVVRRWLKLGSAAGHDPHPRRYHRMMLAGDLVALSQTMGRRD
jgi:GT2 family glycosyltransferase